MRLTFISVGKEKKGPLADATEDYLERLRHVVKVAVIELKAAKGPTARRDEAQAILGALQGGEVVVALDAGGTALDSVGLARWLQVHRDGARDVSFVVGGDEGLDRPVVERASLVLSLSRLTLPHRLARLVLAEQVYRAFTIMRGEPYHK